MFDTTIRGNMSISVVNNDRGRTDVGPVISFLDLEIDSRGSILDIGAIKSDGASFHNPSRKEFTHFLTGSDYVCGHNIINHDLRYIEHELFAAFVNASNVIDTLHLSPLLFPTHPYHKLVKDDKLQVEELNNPLNDSIKARDLFHAELTAFHGLQPIVKDILFLLLRDEPEFSAFFRFIGYQTDHADVHSLISLHYGNEVCSNAEITEVISQHPVELAYCLSLVDSFMRNKNLHSLTPRWVLKNYPEVERIMLRLRNKPCITGCPWCNKALNIYDALKRYFKFDSYRTYGGEPLQEKAVKAAVANESIIAIFPTGGGKSITFQVPALMSADNSKGLTVIVSPLQSLMKDQVDNLEKHGITKAVTINGLLDPIERSKAIERIEEGSASILYISPESLRSRTIERLILGRKIARFVIDEAHCFSSWGQDFRVDYLYIGDFIKSLQEKKNLEEGIPVSCFTATAKQKVIEDIRDYFKEKLDLDLEVFSSKASRTNLHFEVFERESEDEKYHMIKNLIEEKNCPTIIYVSRTRRATELAKKLVNDGHSCRAFHGKMEAAEKMSNQNAFIEGEVRIMVATSAFGMGVDKKDVGMVIHYDISDSLENYVQEAGRAGRDESMSANCYVLYSEEDLNKHFILLNQTRLSAKEIQQVWKAVKDLTRVRAKVSNSALEIARRAGWDESVIEIETRVTTAIAALEDAGYVKRGQNMPRIFANSILAKNAQEAIDRINTSERFDDRQKELANRIIRKLFSSRSKKGLDDDAGESRIDYISDHLGIVKAEVIKIINLLCEENILAKTRDLSAFIKRGESINKSLAIVESFAKLEVHMLPRLQEIEQVYNIKELNESAEANGCDKASTGRIKTVLNFWAIKNWVKKQNAANSKSHFSMCSLLPPREFREKMQKRHELSRFVVTFLYHRSTTEQNETDSTKEEFLVEFSVHELKIAYESTDNLFKLPVSIDDIEDTLFYLSRIEAIKIEGGFLVVYNALTIERLHNDNRKQYTKDDYQKLNQFYENKVQQIHIVGEYAKKMIRNYRDALQFVEDYFQLNYSSFLKIYFPGSRADQLRLKITPAKFEKLFGSLSASQLEIVKDGVAKQMIVAAGPGSGKTRILVHKLASLLLMEEVKHEQLLMLTFSRASATEFKERLIKLIGNAAHFIEIKTFHSYCFEMLGRIGSLEKTDQIIQETVGKIKDGEVESSKITKSVLVIDEAQDMNAHEFALVQALIDHNEEMRIVAVGDDDQNIYEWRGSDSKYLKHLIDGETAVKYELIENYRSRSNLVTFANEFVTQIPNRLKKTPAIAIRPENGNIRIVKHKGNRLIQPVIEDILSTGLAGSTCVLTKTNSEAFQIAGLLARKGLPTKLIQGSDSFNLFNLLEIRYFADIAASNDNYHVISDDMWEDSVETLKNKFADSPHLELCLNMIRKFDALNNKTKYKSDLLSYIRESQIEDFYSGNADMIFISTIHKAKGREFDNIFMMLQDFDVTTNAAKRQLYVGMTRAKDNLSIHLNRDYLDHLTAENVVINHDDTIYAPLEEVAMQLTLKDIHLNFFIPRQNLVAELRTGDKLRYDGEFCLNRKGQAVMRFSRSFQEKITLWVGNGFVISQVKINFIVYWKKEDAEEEILVVIPALTLTKNLDEIKTIIPN